MLKRSSSIQSGRRPVKRVKNTRTKRAQPRASIPNIRPRLEVKAKQNNSDFVVNIAHNDSYPFNFGLVTSGSDEDNRNGKLIKHLDYDFTFQASTLDSFPNGNFRLILGTVSGRFSDAAPTNTIDVLDNFDTGLASIFNVMRAYDPDTTKSFKIHHDQVYNLQSGTTNDAVSGDAAGVVKLFQLPTIRASFEQEYNGDDDVDVGNMKHFGLFLNSNTSVIGIAWNVQCRFVDI